ncbi:hypothetical protein F2Q70_00021564 [Brassica cretica]|uniref:Uncharacterized protein n=1 Tax=Brassica cretica TaxID=69181 RepID=A0A8S9GS26_BRACR|nr:hypothetical protein F2Q70_00021564 [Brassica cretica]
MSFPWLPSKCKSCNKWGHDTKDCLAVPGTYEILRRESAVKGSLAANDSGNAQSARSDPADTGASKSQKKTMSAESRSKQLFEPKSPATLATAKGSGSLYECSSKMATPIVTLAGVEKPSEILKPGKEWSTVSPSKAAKQPVKETVMDEISSPSRFSSISGMEDGFDNGDDEEVNCDEKPFEDDRVECRRVKLVESKNPKLTKQRETFGTVTRASTRASQSLHTDGKSCGVKCSSWNGRTGRLTCFGSLQHVPACHALPLSSQRSDPSP